MLVTVPLVQSSEAGIRLLDGGGLVILGEVEDDPLDERLDAEAGSQSHREQTMHFAELVTEAAPATNQGLNVINFL